MPERRDHAVLDRAVLGDQDRQRTSGLETHEFDMLEPRVDFVRHTTPAPASIRTTARCFSERAFEPAPLRRRRTWLSIRARSSRPKSPNSSSASTNNLKPCWVGIRPALACGA